MPLNGGKQLQRFEAYTTQWPIGMKSAEEIAPKVGLRRPVEGEPIGGAPMGDESDDE